MNQSIQRLCKFLVTAMVLTCCSHETFAGIRLPALFADHMVLQQKSSVAIWGWASPGEKVIITGSWNQRSIIVIADDSGHWKARLQTVKAGGPYTIKVQGIASQDLSSHGDHPASHGTIALNGSAIAEDMSSIQISDVWLGEVWLCSGQSNMNFPMAKLGSWRTGIFDYESEVAASSDSLLRMFTVRQDASEVPLDDVKGSWQSSGPSTTGSFSAVAYYFAREIRRSKGVPVGIIHSSVGGTAAESWMAYQALRSDTAFASVFDLYAKAVREDPKKARGKGPSVLYNAMIRPLVPYTLRGICWYQGESNSDRAMQYRKLFPALIFNWRKDWQADLPFYFVQIAPQYSKEPTIREAQFLTYRRVANTGMVVLTDAGDSLNIHPRNKKIVGERLSLWALNNVYGEKRLVCSGPLYKSMSIEGDKIRISFDFTSAGLKIGDGTSGGDKASSGKRASSGDRTLREFTIAGPDSVFVEARATIEGNTVVVSSAAVSHPVAVRFAWKNFPRPNLYNREGLPASPFRTDDWPVK